MAQINEAKKNTLATLGYTGSVDDAYHNYLVAESGQNLLSTQDLEKYLFSELGYTGAVYDMWFEFLRDNGFTNSLQDMLHAFWNSDSAGLSPLYFSELYAPLTHSLVLERGTGSPTFTRADATNCATFRDWEGWQRTVPSGCARFEGARMVRNLVATTSEDFSNAAWTKENVVVAADQTVAPDGTTTADKLTPSGAVAFADILNSVTVAAGRTVVLSVYAKKATSDFIFLRLTMADFAPYTYFNLNTGAVGTTGAGITATITSLDDGWYRCAVRGVVSAAPPADRVDIGVSSVDGALGATASDSIYIWGAQLEDVTGQADQTAGEYVSVGVLSAPYHGAGVDGVEFFNTDRDGAVIPAATNTGYLAEGSRTNLCLQSNAFTTTWTANGSPAATQNVIGPDGGTTGWTLTDNNAASIEGVSQTIALTAATYTYSVFVNKTTGAQSSYPVIATDNGVSRIAACTVDTTNGVATVWTAYTGLTVQTSSATCVSHNENYWRVSLTFLATAENWTHYLIVAATTNATQSTGSFDQTAQGSAVFYGAQVELGSSASTYIATTTAAVTRAADVLTYTGGDIPNIKTLAATFSRGVGVNSNGYAVALSDGTTNNYISMSTPSATQARFLGVTGGVTQWDTIPAYTAGVTSKVSQSFATNDIKMDKDGTAQTADTVATVPTFNQINVGHITNSFVFNGLVNHIYGWTRNLSQSELGAITA